MNHSEYLEKRNALIADMDKAHTAGDHETFTAKQKEFEGIEAEFEKSNQVETRNAVLEAARNSAKAPARERIAPNAREERTETRGNKPDPRETVEYRNAFLGYLAGDLECRTTLSAVKGPNGAYFLPPAQLDNEIIQSAKTSLGLLSKTDLTILNGPMGTQGVTVRSRTGNVYKGTKLDFSNSSQEMALTMAQRNLRAWPFTAVVLADNLWLGSNLISDPMAWLKGQLEEVMEEKEDYLLLYGTGVEEPLGILTADADGVPTARVISTGATTGRITLRTLLSAFYAVRPHHRKNAEWYFSTAALNSIEGILDSQNRPIIRDGYNGASNGPTRTILGLPVVEHEQIDSGTVTAGDFAASAKMGFIGNLKKVKSVKSRLGGVRVSTEARFTEFETVITALYFLDALPADAEAFAVVATAAS